MAGGRFRAGRMLRVGAVDGSALFWGEVVVGEHISDLLSGFH